MVQFNALTTRSLAAFFSGSEAKQQIETIGQCLRDLKVVRERMRVEEKLSASLERIVE